MKHFFLLALFLASCSTMQSQKQFSALSFNKVISLELGKVDESQIILAFGEPTSRSEKIDYYTLTYDDPKTGFQRLSLNFVSSNKKLSSLLWLPQGHEKEFSLAGARGNFKKAEFKESHEASKISHIISSTISFRDEKSGILIRLNEGKDTVQAIAKFDTQERIPASHSK